jgi:hypothetical protein
MGLFRRSVKVLLRGDALTEPQINAALAVAEDTPLWRAVMQLIATAEENANQNAQDSMDPPTVMAGYVGGASHLRMLRDELTQRREEGIKELGERRLNEKL